MPPVRALAFSSLIGGLALLLVGLVGGSALALNGFLGQPPGANARDNLIRDHAADLMDRGRDTFRNDTFGSEGFFGAIGLHRAIEGTRFGGVKTDLGLDGVSPATALGVGLKVDAAALPQAVKDAVAAGKVDLTDPGVTLALLKLNAVVGVEGSFNADGSLKSVGITCALCHSTVDNSFANGIGQRLDGVPNRDLDVGLIVSLAPNLQPVADLLNSAGPQPDQPSPITPDLVRGTLRKWGPGKFDAEVFMDGKVINPATGKPAPTLIPPAYGLAGVNMHTFTGWGSVTYWNAFVANLEMHGSPGTFFDPRLDEKDKFPIAAVNRFGHISSPPAQDRITDKLAALHFYQLSLPAPVSPFAGQLDPAAVGRGQAVFEGQARCAACHVPPLFTEPGWNMHTAKDIGIDEFQAERSPDERYRTTPLGGLGSRVQQQGGFYHDGRFASLAEVVDHYNDFQRLRLSPQQKADLIEYLKSL
jgi:Di-haem oxidoreductase, putative peroxidase